MHNVSYEWIAHITRKWYFENLLLDWFEVQTNSFACKRHNNVNIYIWFFLTLTSVTYQCKVNNAVIVICFKHHSIIIDFDF
jgi:hypothetical protein